MMTALNFLVYSVALFITGVQAVILYQIATNRINLQFLVSDENGDASLSRFQFLVFTFVIGAGFLFLTVKGTGFPAVDEGVLMLLGISGATYALGKTLDKPTPTTVVLPAPSPDPGPGPTVVVSKTTQTTTAAG